MKLAELAKGIGNSKMRSGTMPALEIAGVTCDSRHVRPGYLFAALPGSVSDGASFISQALDKGASAILAANDVKTGYGDAPVVRSDNPRRDFARIAARFYDRQPETIAAITGTNGKTSVAVFLRQIWNALGCTAGSVGTLGSQATGPDVNVSHDGSLTTPDPAGLHRMLSDMQNHGVEYLAIEASSHGLDQYRLDGLNVSLAAFTNLSRDHLDYHGDMEGYFRAKARLFSEVLSTNGTAVLNADVPEVDALSDVLAARDVRVLTYGYSGRFLTLKHREPLAEGQRVSFLINGSAFELTVPLLGAFQVSNVLCALALAVASGFPAGDCAGALVGLTGVRGRLELAGKTASGGRVYVDYAHTPDALMNVLQSVRPHTGGRVHVVFGCGGNRDPGKRRLMGEVAARYADVVVVTDDNPRREDPASIRQQAMAGCPNAANIGDRQQAIRSAIGRVQSDDLLIVAGKGHEQGQVVGEEIRPFDDLSVVRSILERGQT